MARRDSDYSCVRKIADRGNDRGGPDSRARGEDRHPNRIIADRGSGRVGADPWDFEIKRLRQRVRDLELQHQIRRLKQWIRDLKASSALDETEPERPVGDEYYGEEEYQSNDDFIYASPPIYDEYGDEEDLKIDVMIDDRLIHLADYDSGKDEGSMNKHIGFEEAFLCNVNANRSFKKSQVFAINDHGGVVNATDSDSVATGGKQVIIGGDDLSSADPIKTANKNGDLKSSLKVKDPNNITVAKDVDGITQPIIEEFKNGMNIQRKENILVSNDEDIVTDNDVCKQNESDYQEVKKILIIFDKDSMHEKITCGLSIPNYGLHEKLIKSNGVPYKNGYSDLKAHATYKVGPQGVLTKDYGPEVKYDERNLPRLAELNKNDLLIE